MLKKPHYIALILVVLLPVVLLKLPDGAIGRLKLAVSGLFLPLFGLAGSGRDVADRAAGTVVSRGELLRENEDLRRENAELKIRVAQGSGVANENARLRAQVAWARSKAWKVHHARVIARDPANWWHSVMIDIGLRDGITTNDAVMTTDGLVGRVQSADQTRAVVVLLGNPELRVAAVVTNDGETGVINCTSSTPQENNMVDLDYLSGGSKVEPGNTVETWGEGGIFPPHIPIGKIVDRRSQEFGLTTGARVRLAANLGALQEVWVMAP